MYSLISCIVSSQIRNIGIRRRSAPQFVVAPEHVEQDAVHRDGESAVLLLLPGRGRKEKRCKERTGERKRGKMACGTSELDGSHDIVFAPRRQMSNTSQPGPK